MDNAVESQRSEGVKPPVIDTGWDSDADPEYLSPDDSILDGIPEIYWREMFSAERTVETFATSDPSRVSVWIGRQPFGEFPKDRGFSHGNRVKVLIWGYPDNPEEWGSLFRVELPSGEKIDSSNSPAVSPVLAHYTEAVEQGGGDFETLFQILCEKYRTLDNPGQKSDVISAMKYAANRADTKAAMGDRREDGSFGRAIEVIVEQFPGDPVAIETWREFLKEHTPAGCTSSWQWDFEALLRNGQAQ